MANKIEIITAKEAAALIKDGDTVLVGGFMTNGTAKSICNEVTAKNLTVISNDGGFPGEGVGRLIRNNCVKRLVTSHIGLNQDAAEKYQKGEMELKLQPLGTLAEQIRAGGAGLAGIITPTGVGTIVADTTADTTLENKQVVELDGEEYILERAIKGDIAIVQGFIADEVGNIRYKGTTRNFNTIMASNADITIVEVEKIVPAGDIGPDYVETPYIFVNYLVLREPEEGEAQENG